MNQSNDILIFLAIFIAGGIIGFFICHLTLGRKKANAQQQALDKSNAELEEYKAKVNNHFTGSAELMGQVASSYQALYNHMAGQSQSLLGETDASPFPLLKTPATSNLESTISKDETELDATQNIIEDEDIKSEEKPAKDDQLASENSDKEDKHPESNENKADSDEKQPESDENKADSDEKQPESDESKTDYDEKPTDTASNAQASTEKTPDTDNKKV